MLRDAAMVIFAMAASCCAFAHEFWVASRPANPAVDAPTAFTLHVGEYFTGELVGVTAAHAASIRVISARSERDVTSLAPRGSMLQALTLAFAHAGSHVVAYESHPSEVVLAADKFNAYLHDEGLDAIVRQREAAGLASSAGRERFRRSAKTLLRVGGKPDGASTRSVGQRLEITPLSDPLSAAAGATLGFELRFEGNPRPDVLVKAWHKLGGQTTVLRATTDARGRFTFVLPFAGMWMLNAVHMIPATDSPGVDWDSFWGSLTFDLSRQ